MKLNVERSDEKVDKPKSKRKKKETGPKLCKNYKSMKSIRLHNVDLNMTKMTYGTMQACDVSYVCLEDGILTLENSWLEFILVLLNKLITDYPKDFRDKMLEFNITNQFFCVDNTYGKYSFTDVQYKVYKIIDTKYYLEFVDNVEYKFDAIYGLLRALEIPIDAVIFHLIDKEYIDLDLNMNKLSEVETVVNIDSLGSMIKSGIHMVSIDLQGESTRIHRVDVAMAALFNWAHKKYKNTQLLEIERVSCTGICKHSDIDSVGEELGTVSFTPITGSKLVLYTDGNEDDIVKFMQNTVKTLNIDSDKIKFKFRALKAKEKLKEYELD